MRHFYFSIAKLNQIQKISSLTHRLDITVISFLKHIICINKNAPFILFCFVLLGFFVSSVLRQDLPKFHQKNNRQITLFAWYISIREVLTYEFSIT